jgi:hypothetical protein
VLQTLNTKVIKQVALFNNAKGSIEFYLLVWAGTAVQVNQKLGAREQYSSACFCIFHTFALKISNANLHQSCVPWKTAHFSYWVILKCLVKFWRTCQSSRMAQGVIGGKLGSKVGVWPTVDLGFPRVVREDIKRVISTIYHW